ncbi:hypothetical protein I7I48_07671 [Histoplasma ohiense]|nr:hypothetical protein I7I48_07671 [Histoplasma ohiense (nom. inval.)]
MDKIIPSTVPGPSSIGGQRTSVGHNSLCNSGPRSLVSASTECWYWIFTRFSLYFRSQLSLGTFCLFRFYFRRCY